MPSCTAIVLTIFATVVECHISDFGTIRMVSFTHGRPRVAASGTCFHPLIAKSFATCPLYFAKLCERGLGKRLIGFGFWPLLMCP